LKITVVPTGPTQIAAEALVLGVPSGAALNKALTPLRKTLGGALAKAIKRSEFTGKKGQLCDIAGSDKLKAPRIALVGLGDPAEVTPAELRRLAARGARYASSINAVSLALGTAGVAVDGADAALVQGAVLGAYRYEQYKTGDRVSKFPLAKVTIGLDKKVDAATKQRAATAQRVAEAVCIARDLINMPPNDLYPEALADFAQKVCADRKDAGLSCTILKHAQIKQRGMALIDAVGRGSARPPALVHMKYRPVAADKNAKLVKLAFVGKGLTFDTGGICIKPAPGMEEMKGDMGGAANVIALMAALAAAQPMAEIHGIIATAENMPDGNAYRPGDIFKSYQGKTVEIINTDAEGRLVLADALHFAVEQQVDFILDNATLTGACVVALGPTVSGVYSNRDALAACVRDASQRAGEAMWHMPLVEDLREMLKSDWADLKHMGDRWGGSITAALFLREFVSEVPWVHVDIAGPSMASKAYDLFAKGGTGHGVLTFLELIDHFVQHGIPAESAAAHQH
jgi:leucyl aminopeptidase